jgi:poly(A) polymerase
VHLLESLSQFFAARRLTTYLVGGFVRDSLLRRPCHDIDLAVMGDASLAAQELARALGGTPVPLDPERGIFRVALHSGEQRPAGEEATSPELWTVDLSGVAGSIQEDLARRDFTVDAIAVPLPAALGPPVAWPLVDPFGGQRDLGAGVVRAVDPQAFQDDPLRLLRAVRLAAQLRFTIEPGTLALLAQDAPLLARVSAERLRDELLAILAQPDLARSLDLLDRHGLLAALLPELTPAKGVSQPFEHYWDVYTHSLQSAVMMERILDPDYRRREPAGQAIPWKPWLDGYFAQEVSDGHSRATLLKLAALLHDVAKPETKTVEPSGRARFLGHPELGAKKTEAILRRLRLSGHGVAMARTLVEHHLRPGQMAQRDQFPTPRAVYRYFQELGQEAIAALYLNLADYLAARGPTLDLEKWRFHCQSITFTLEQGTAQAEPQAILKLVDGNDLMALFGLQPGPHLRPLLEAVREAQATGEVTMRQEALALVQELLRRQVTPDNPRAPEAVGERHHA